MRKKRKEFHHLGLDMPEFGHTPTRQEMVVLYIAVNRVVGKMKFIERVAVVAAMVHLFDYVFGLLGWFGQ